LSASKEIDLGNTGSIAIGEDCASENPINNIENFPRTRNNVVSTDADNLLRDISDLLGVTRPAVKHGNA
jgi:hypothetical protein